MDYCRSPRTDIAVFVLTVTRLNWKRRYINHAGIFRSEVEYTMLLITQPVMSDFERLTGRERTVAALVGQGLRNREIADSLNLSEGTVKLHVHKILQKLNISSRRSLYLADKVLAEMRSQSTC